jgi:hypothetical protein
VFKFTRDLEISVNLLSILTKEPMTAVDAAERCGTTQHMMNMVASKLRRAGLIKTKKGRNGGLYTDRKDDISTFEVISVFYNDPSDVLSNTRTAASRLNETVINFFRALPVSGIPDEPLSELKRHEQLIGDDEYSGEAMIVWEEEIPVKDQDFMMGRRNADRVKDIEGDPFVEDEDEELSWD